MNVSVHVQPASVEMSVNVLAGVPTCQRSFWKEPKPCLTVNAEHEDARVN